MKPDWIISRIERTTTPLYPIQVTGKNLNFPADHPSHVFAWSIPARSLLVDNPGRYDISSALGDWTAVGVIATALERLAVEAIAAFIAGRKVRERFDPGPANLTR